MTIFRALLTKDLKRILKNPTPVIILIIIPFIITALIGGAMGGIGNNDDQEIAPIRLGIVDHDQSVFSQFLNGMVGQEDFQERIAAQFLEEEEAMKMVKKGKLSAILIIPEDFTHSYVTGDDQIKLTLIKNPSEYIYPTVAQEGADLIVTALNTIARNFREDLHEIYGVIEDDREFDLLRDMVAISEVWTRAVNRLEAAEDYLNPPLVSYERETVEEGEQNAGPEFNLFSYLLIGIGAMFVLMIGDNCMRDLYRESRFRTLERFRTLQEGLFGFVFSKVTYTVIVLMITSFIILGGGSLVFRFQWNEVDKVALLMLSYCFFSAGFMGFIAALAGKEKRADLLNTVIIIGLSMVGGCMWPVESLPEFIQHNVAPYVPTYWISSAIRGLQPNVTGMNYQLAIALLVVLGLLLIIGACGVFQQRLQRGIKE